jgi:hypothetical protein
VALTLSRVPPGFDPAAVRQQILHALASHDEAA